VDADEAAGRPGNGGSKHTRQSAAETSACLKRAADTGRIVCHLNGGMGK